MFVCHRTVSINFIENLHKIQKSDKLLHAPTQQCYFHLPLCHCQAGYTLFIFRILPQMFSRNTPQNTKHSLYTFRISCKFRFLLMLQKTKPRNPLSFRSNADSGTKYHEMRNAKKVMQNTCYNFVFCILRSFSGVLR